MWRKTWIALLISRIAKRITTNCSDPVSPSSMKALLSPHEKLRSPNTMIFQQETNNTSLQDTKFQPLDLWDEGSIYRWLQGGESASGIWLVSSLWYFLIPLGDWWSLTHPWANAERQVSQEKFLEDYMIFHLANWPCHLSTLAHRTP